MMTSKSTSTVPFWHVSEYTRNNLRGVGRHAVPEARDECRGGAELKNRYERAGTSLFIHLHRAEDVPCWALASSDLQGNTYAQTWPNGIAEIRASESDLALLAGPASSHFLESACTVRCNIISSTGLNLSKSTSGLAMCAIAKLSMTRIPFHFQIPGFRNKYW